MSLRSTSMPMPPLPPPPPPMPRSPSSPNWSYRDRVDGSLSTYRGIAKSKKVLGEMLGSVPGVVRYKGKVGESLQWSMNAARSSHTLYPLR